MPRNRVGIHAPRVLFVCALTAALVGTHREVGGGASSDEIPSSEDAGSYFLISKLNVGLRASTDEPDLETPHAMLKSFLASCQRGDFARAAHCLDLNFLPPQDQQDKGAELARKLFFLVEHQLWIDWEAFPDRPDGQQDTFASADNGSAAGLQRSIKLGGLAHSGRVAELRVERVKARDSAAVWVFSRQTAEDVDTLYREYGPNRFERELPAFLTGPTIGRIPLWIWFGFAAILGFSVVVGWSIQRIAVLIVRRAGGSTFGLLSESLRGPMACLLGLSLFHFLSNRYLRIAAPIQAFLEPVAASLWIASLAWLLMRAAKQVSFVWARRYERLGGSWANARITQITMLRYLVVFLIFAGGTLLALRQFQWFRELGSPLLTSAGVVGVVVGLAAHRSIGNLIAVIQLALTQPVSAGDAVLYGGDFGWIEEIGFTFVVIRTWDQRRVITPIAHLIDNPIVNWSKKSEAIISYIFVYIDFGADIEVLRREYERILESAEDWDHQTPPILQVTDWRDSSLELRGLCSACTPTRAWNLQCYVREHLLAFVQSWDGGRYLPRTRILMERDKPFAAADERIERTESLPQFERNGQSAGRSDRARSQASYD